MVMFESLLLALILRHQSTYSMAEEKSGSLKEDALENWNASFIITTGHSSLIRYVVIKRNLSGNCIIWKTAFSYLTKYKSSRCRYCYHAYRQSLSYVITAEAYLSFYLPLCRIFSHYSMNMCKRGWISGMWFRISPYFRNFIIAATNILKLTAAAI